MADPFGLETEPRVVLETERFLAVEKPCRMHSAPGSGSGDLCSWVFDRYPSAAAVRAPGLTWAPRRQAREGGLLHRIDFETSGLVLFALDDEFFAYMLGEQNEGRFLKEYLALSSPARSDGPRGSMPPRGLPLGVDGTLWSEAREAGNIGAMASLIEARRGVGGAARIECAFRPYGPGSRSVACVASGARARRSGRVGPDGAAMIVYRAFLLGARRDAPPDWADEGEALELRLLLERGFRHQLRAQLAWAGLPILGDRLYGGASARRLCLRAIRVAFRDPESGRALVIGADGRSPADSAMGELASLLFVPKADRLIADG